MGLTQGWSLEPTRFHSTSVVICKVINYEKRTPTIGTYLPPSTLENLPDLEEALTCFRYQDPIVLGDLNDDIGQAQNPCSQAVSSQQIADLLMEFGMMELLHHLRQF